MRRDRLQLLRRTNAALLVLDAAGLVFAAVGVLGAALLASSGRWSVALACLAVSAWIGTRVLLEGRRELGLRRALRRGRPDDPRRRLAAKANTA